MSFPQPAGKNSSQHFSLKAELRRGCPKLWLRCDCRKITALQINNQIWILAQFRKVSCDPVSGVPEQRWPVSSADLPLTLPHRKSAWATGAEFKQDVSRAHPRPSGAQARRAMFERMNTEPAKYAPGSRPRVHALGTCLTAGRCFCSTDPKSPNPN